MANKLTFVLGGARSGKTAFAEGVCNRHNVARVYIATAQALDAEMSVRIERHRQTRGAGFTTIEAPIELSQAVRDLKGPCITLIDCLTLWISNLMADGSVTDEMIFSKAADLISASRSVDAAFVVVSNETGLGIVPDNALARRFRDVSGKVNQMIAAASDEVYFITAGLPMKLKG